MVMSRMYGPVCYTGIDTDPDLKYPKGAGRVTFSTQQSFLAAINSRFVQLQHGDIDKRVARFNECLSICRISYFYFHILTKMMTLKGRSETVRAGGSDLRRVSRAAQWRETRSILLCQCRLLTVLL